MNTRRVSRMNMRAPMTLLFNITPNRAFLLFYAVVYIRFRIQKLTGKLNQVFCLKYFNMLIFGKLFSGFPEFGDSNDYLISYPGIVGRAIKLDNFIYTVTFVKPVEYNACSYLV